MFGTIGTGFSLDITFFSWRRRRDRRAGFVALESSSYPIDFKWQTNNNSLSERRKGARFLSYLGLSKHFNYPAPPTSLQPSSALSAARVLKRRQSSRSVEDLPNPRRYFFEYLTREQIYSLSPPTLPLVRPRSTHGLAISDGRSDDSHKQG